MINERLLGLKVDVDTRQGMDKGVPSLLSTLSTYGCRATFFLSFGPDNSGKAVCHLLRNPRFLLKVVRTNAPGLYGMKTALYGTLLPAPMIASARSDLCREIEIKGHEVELHAWDHRAWQDHITTKGQIWVRDWLDRAISSYVEVLGHPPQAFGAPAWLLSETAVKVMAGYTWRYLSCTRAAAPFVLAGTNVLEIPSDLPCLEEVGGRRGTITVLRALSRGGIHVLPVHAEAEGGIWQAAFIEILNGALELGYRIIPLSEIAEIFLVRNCSVRPFRMAMLPGRAFSCAV